jgi:hypothetical protein
MGLSRAEILSEYERYYEQLLKLNYGQVREHIAERDVPQKRFRWKVTLECGCITECLTYGQERPPSDGTHHALNMENSGGHASRLAFVVDFGSVARDADDPSIDVTHPGILWCAAHDDEAPVREITRWLKARESVSQTGKQYLAWKVVLSCGHIDSPVLSGFEWKPEHGHIRDEALETKIRAGIDSGKLTMDWHFASHLATGHWMEPQTHDACWKCKCCKRIASFEPAGRLTWKGDRLLTTKKAKQLRLHTAQDRAADLRNQLARVEAEIASLGRLD